MTQSTLTMDLDGTGNWSNITGDPNYAGWDPNEPIYCYTANEFNIKAYLIPIYQILGPVLLVLCGLSFIGNTAVLATVFFIRKKHLTPTLIFSLSLAGADAVAAFAMGLGFFVNNILLYNFDIHVRLRDCIVLVVETFRLATMVCSAFHFLVLAVNHWMGITKPLHYASRMTRRTACLCIATMWNLPVIVFFAYFSLVPNQGFRSDMCLNVDFAHQFTFRAFVSALFFGPMALMSLFYLHVFYVIQRHQKKLDSLDIAGINDEKRRMQSKTKALITTLIILLTYLIGWLPAVLVYVLVCDNCIVPLSISLCVRLPVNIVTNLLIILKLLIDPIIYTARIQEVRMVIQYFLGRWGCRKRDDTPATFSRFNSSRSASIMTSLRYSTYNRQRKESDSSSAILQRLSTSTPTRRGPQLLGVNNAGGTAGGGCLQRKASNTSNGGVVARETMASLRPGTLYPNISPLEEVSESSPNHNGSCATQNGHYGAMARAMHVD